MELRLKFYDFYDLKFWSQKMSDERISQMKLKKCVCLFIFLDECGEEEALGFCKPEHVKTDPHPPACRPAG